MTSPLPEKPLEPAVGQRPDALADAKAEAEAYRIIGDFATSYRDDRRTPAFGDAPPVAQPGRAPMSTKAADDTARMLGASVLVIAVGVATTIVLLASHYANPKVVALVVGAPVALALAISRLLRRARPEPEVHHHYEGDVYQDQRQVRTRTLGVWAKTNNEERR